MERDAALARYADPAAGMVRSRHRIISAITMRLAGPRLEAVNRRVNGAADDTKRIAAAAA